MRVTCSQINTVIQMFAITSTQLFHLSYVKDQGQVVDHWPHLSFNFATNSERYAFQTKEPRKKWKYFLMKTYGLNWKMQAHLKVHSRIPKFWDNEKQSRWFLQRKQLLWRHEIEVLCAHTKHEACKLTAMISKEWESQKKPTRQRNNGKPSKIQLISCENFDEDSFWSIIKSNTLHFFLPSACSEVKT